MIFDPGRSGKDFMYLDDNSLSESIVLRLISCIKDKKQRNIKNNNKNVQIIILLIITNNNNTNSINVQSYKKYQI